MVNAEDGWICVSEEVESLSPSLSPSIGLERSENEKEVISIVLPSVAHYRGRAARQSPRMPPKCIPPGVVAAGPTIRKQLR